AEELNSYLARSRQNYAVLTEYSAIETYAPLDPAMTFQSMKTLGSFPEQVIILKGAMDCCGIIGEPALYPEIFIEAGQTKGFRQFFRDLELAKHGSIQQCEGVLKHGIAAKTQLARIHSSTEKVLEGLIDLSKTYTTAEIQAIRNGIGIRDMAVLNRATANALDFAGLTFSTHPSVNRTPSFEELSDTFIFRHAICAQSLLLKWIESGSQVNLASMKIRNDVVDINFATFALYFDGLLTKDKKLNSIYENAKRLLQYFRNENS
ncbi:MAG TPA: hypothetical protein VIG33_00095, partial [Pseudobdellovibrionaceae bacterium]